VPITASGERSIEFAQQFFLFGCQLDRGLNLNATKQVAGGMAANRLNALASDSKNLAGLGLCRNLQFNLTLKSRHTDGTTERGSYKGNRYGTGQIGTITGKNGVPGYLDIDRQIPGRASILSGFALTPKPYTISIVNARRHFNGQRLVMLCASAPMAITTRLLNFFFFVSTTRTSLLHRKETLLTTHLAMAVTGITGNRAAARLCAITAAGLANLHRGQFDIDGIAKYGLL
jgi:hypothetical protein